MFKKYSEIGKTKIGIYMFVHLYSNQINSNMKKIFLVTVFAAFLMACDNQTATTETGEAQEVETTTGATSDFAASTTESSIAWEGTKPNGDSHTGTVALKSGKLAMDNGAIAGGNFVIDLTQMTVTDEGMDDESKAKLIGHLTTGDFFEVEKYPTAAFEVTGATADSLTGNLTIKDVTKSITVPYFAQVDGGKAMVNASFTIDRTLWGVTYNSGNFFQNLGDYLIDDAVKFDVKLVATAK
jgi:polyisoprenoid-binding protein YceI